MTCALIVVSSLTVVAAPAASDQDAGAGNPRSARPDPIFLHMPDGQVITHSIRVYVNVDIPAGASPKLRLYGGNSSLEPSPGGDGRWSPMLVAPGQQWLSPQGEGQPQVGVTGTLLLFDLSGLDFDLKAMRRLRPVLEWSEGGSMRTAVGTTEVNVGRTAAAIAWTSLIVGTSLFIVIVLSWMRGGSPALLLTGTDGHLSLAQTQIAMWTVAVGAIVVGYGLIRLQIPEIPMSLLALMGASLATGGLAFFGDTQKVKQAVAATGVAAPVQRTWRFGDLLRNFPPGGAPELSLAKAQMLFWTLLLIVLFASKSILDGGIWTVPWPLVALMGFSQAGYLAPKLT